MKDSDLKGKIVKLCTDVISLENDACYDDYEMWFDDETMRSAKDLAIEIVKSIDND
jgi:hypothetical protein